MTVTEPATPVCPSCGSLETMILSDGNGRCFDCMSEWDPKNLAGIPRAARPAPVTVDTPDVGDVPLPPTPELPPFGLPSTDEVFGSERGAETVRPAGLDHDLVGGFARLEGGQYGEVIARPDDDHIEVVFSDGRAEVVPLADVEAISPRPLAPEPEAPSEPDPASVVAIEYVYMLSDLMIRMGIASIVDGEDGPEAGPPVLGWLTRDEELHQLVEAAVATTVARLIVSYDIPVDDLLEGLNAETPADE